MLLAGTSAGGIPITAVAERCPELVDRLVYLSYGLSFILAFIGVKLVLHALHENTLPFINDGQHVPVPEISTALSLAVIVGTLIITTVASLVSSRRAEKSDT